MSRIEFAGRGFPIPEIALPDPNLSSDLPVQSLELVDGAPFQKASWASLGYTHYEVWCIGGVGGRGAPVWGGVEWTKTITREVAPPDVWARVLASYQNSANNSFYTQYTGQSPPGTPYPGVGVIMWEVDPVSGWIHWILTPEGLAQVQNPTHEFDVTTYHNPPRIRGGGTPIYLQSGQLVNNDPLLDSGGVLGGAGGGGGLHVVSGELADLPDSVPISVGAAGIDASAAQDTSSGLVTPYTYGADPSGFNDPWFFRYDGPMASFPPGTPGGDGGTSSFGDIAQASGGKGGGPAIVWINGARYFVASGGDGGSGDRVAAGGGAAGSTSAATGQAGSWDGTVGKGGGGGRGGMEDIQRAPILRGIA